MVIEQVMDFVQSQIVQAAITKLLTSLNPAGAFIQAIIAIYNTVMFFVERLRQIAQVAAASSTRSPRSPPARSRRPRTASSRPWPAC